MKNAWLIFKDDCKRLSRNAVTVIAVLGLVILPSIFSWYNILACWNVFENTGNLTVAVANSDEGYQSDLVPFKMNFGDQIVSALRENDQLDWVFTEADEAIDGASEGRYYAAVVIPETFSADMMSFYSDDVAHGEITYYSNQKKSAIAPKVTDQGADQVSAKVNETFAETLSEITLGIASTLMAYADEADASGKLGLTASRLLELGAKLNRSADALSSYSTLLGTARELLDGSASLLEQAQQAGKQAASPSEDSKQAIDASANALKDSLRALESALSSIEGEYEKLPHSVDEAFDASAESAALAESLLRQQADRARAAGNASAADALERGANKVKETNDAAQRARENAHQAAAQSQNDLASAKTRYSTELKPPLDELTTSMEDASGAIEQAVRLLDNASGDLTSSARSVSSQLENAQAKLDGAANALNQSSAKLSSLGTQLSQALQSNNAESLRSIVEQDPQTLATFLTSPVRLERHAVYPVENFGSAMSPLYTTLALWIGALLVMVTLKVHPSKRSLSKLENPTLREMFMGRFGVIALITFAQSTCLSVGNLVFLGVQATSPLLYILCFWVAGFVFAFIIYTLVALFANLGKALAVILLIVQVGGGGGSFPMQLLPQFFQAMNPYLPIAHAVNAMRAAMFGIYQADYWTELGCLLVFMVLMGALALVLQAPLSKIVPKFIARVEKSKLM